jgi:diguanylate cyclase (GGDEF)-like protein
MNTLMTNSQIEMLNTMEQEVSRIMRTLQSLKTKIGRDDLTGLLRRDDFFAQVENMIAKAQGGEVSILMVDIDNFKAINDTEGHQAGDLAIKRVAQVIQRCAKAGATAGRYGGEEFIIAHLGSIESAKMLGEALRRQIEKEICVTVSIGVSDTKQANAQLTRMIAQADAALYAAKKSGKNKVCLAKVA